MKRLLLALLVVFVMLPLAGCGDNGSSGPPAFVTDIYSDPNLDGYISQDPTTGAFTVVQGNPQTVSAGVDPATGAEYRAFLDFPLTGPIGVPANAAIVSATLSIFIDNILPTSGTIPIQIDLVSFPPTILSGADFNLPPLASISVPIYQSDFKNFVPIDVTFLLAQAQFLTNFTDFQLRVSVPASPGFITIDDTTANFAPLLRVTYF